MVQRARTELRSAPLYDGFAHSFIERRFGVAVTRALYDAVPVYKQGPRKGLPKGYVMWLSCSVGGWYRPPEAGASGYVLRPGAHHVRVTVERERHAGTSACWLDEHANASDQMRIDAIKKLATPKAKHVVPPVTGRDVRVCPLCREGVKHLSCGRGW